MTKLAHFTALLGVLAIGVSGASCTSHANSPQAAGPTPPSVATDVPPPPRIGQCRNTRASPFDEHGSVDNSPVVDCSKIHTLETVQVIQPTERLTPELRTELADSCITPTSRAYLGAGDSVSKLSSPLVFWPSPAQRAA